MVLAMPMNRSMKSVFAIALSLVVGGVSLHAGDKQAKAEKKQGFEVLFDGSGFYGWQQSGNWVIEEGAAFRKEKGGSLTYKSKKVPDDFELRFEWKVGPRANSGIYYRPGQYEYQILDNLRHGNGRNPRTTAASIYFAFAPAFDAAKPIGVWNTGRIVCKGTVIQHYLNGHKVIDVDYSDKKWAYNVELLAARGGHLDKRGAYLSLQDHGDPVWYRNIRMREIPSLEKVVSKAHKEPKIPAGVLAGEKKKIEGYRKEKK